jgi:hypothetical protein
VLYPLAAAGYVYRPLKEGCRGWDVVALQLGLRGVGATITADGIFGPATKASVVAVQRSENLTADGIAGIVTQTTILLDNIWPQQQRYRTPPGLARGIVEGECGWQIGNHTKPYGDGTRDVGPVMLHVAVTDENVRRAFDAAYGISKLCRRLREGEPGAPYGHDDFFGKDGAKTHKAAWKLAVLAWNWPAAAVLLANGGHLSTAPAQWVIDIGVEGVTSPAQWATHYVESKIAYVTEWPV